MNALDAEAAAPTQAMTAAKSLAIPWHLWCTALAVTSAMVGIQWDISWHRSIGRDAFLTPPHVAIYLCGVLGGLAAAYLVFTATFGPKEGRAASVGVFGLRGPLGAFILAWGGVAMIVSAPFDDWWHNAYGLDVKIISPPHSLLALGMLMVQVGALVLVLGYANRARGALRARLTWLYLYIGGMILVAVITFLMEKTDPTDMHTGEFYATLALALPLVLIGVSHAADHRWASTAMAGVFTVFQLGLLWVLPLFPAAPKLGPVYHPVTHFVPPPFPLLLLVPAVAIDLLRRRAPGLSREGWRSAGVLGALFLAGMMVSQWPLAVFLVSPAARNRIFGSGDYGFNERAWWNFSEENPIQFARNMAIAAALAWGMSRLALLCGDWLRRIRR